MVRLLVDESKPEETWLIYSGLEIYSDELAMENFLPAVVKENLFHFWWD